MAVTVLVILEAAHRHMTIHANHGEAIRSLVTYVANNWRAVMKSAPLPACENERVERFFQTQNYSYFIAGLGLNVTCHDSGPVDGPASIAFPHCTVPF